MPTTHFASLIGCLEGNGKPFFVGSRYDQSQTGSGRLFLRMNGGGEDSFLTSSTY
jgi:hypothetical protein